VTALDRKTRRKKRVNGYNADLKNYTRNLHFMEKDSSVAIMKIRSFNKGDFRPFTKKKPKLTTINPKPDS
jgi:hypothetical protein